MIQLNFEFVSLVEAEGAVCRYLGFTNEIVRKIAMVTFKVAHSVAHRLDGRQSGGVCIPRLQTVRPSVRRRGRVRGFAKPIYFLHFTALLLLWFLVVASLQSSLPLTIPLAAILSVFPEFALAARAARTANRLRWTLGGGRRQTDGRTAAPQGSGWAATPGARRTERTTRRLRAA